MSYGKKENHGRWKREYLKKYRVYDIKNNDAVVGDYTIHELAEFLDMDEMNIRTVMSRDGYFRRKYYISKVGD